MPRAQRLFGLTVDEISSVDRDANGHAAIMFAKRDSGDNAMALFDAEGNEVTLAELNFGDHVFDENGEEQVYMPAEHAEAIAAGFEGYTDEQREQILNDLGLGDYEDPTLEPEGQLDAEDESLLAQVGKRFGAQALTGLRTQAVAKRNAAASRPSLGDAIYGALSKALTDDDQAVAISKAVSALEQRLTASEQNAARAWTVAKNLSEQAELSAYSEVADSYGLPVQSQELAGILRSAATVLSKRELDTLDRVLQSAGDAALFSEIGVNGTGSASAIHDQIMASANTAVSKNDITREQAVVALYEANPDAYDEYLAEQG